MKAESRTLSTGAIALSAVLTISLPANAQTGQKPKPAVGGKPLEQAKPTAPVGCKLVGTVRGTKLWAGDCVASGRRERRRSLIPARSLRLTNRRGLLQEGHSNECPEPEKPCACRAVLSARAGRV
jgi:hypothetical protein